MKFGIVKLDRIEELETRTTEISNTGEELYSNLVEG